MTLRSTLEQLRDFDGALLANTIGYIDSTPAHELYLGGDIQSVTPSLGPAVGVALTCTLDSSTPGARPDVDIYWRTLDEMAKLGVPTIWVVKCRGSRPNHECVIGDGMAKTLHAVGCVGLVTDGGVRDVPGLLSTPFPAYSRGVTIHHGALRFADFGVPVEVGGLTIRPGDIMHGSAEGVIRVPPSCAGALPARAARMRAFEHEAHCALRRTDLSPDAKRREVTRLLAEHGFSV